MDRDQGATSQEAVAAVACGAPKASKQRAASHQLEATKMAAADPLGSTRWHAWWPAFLIAACLAALLVSVGWITHGKPLAEKTLIALSMPMGVIWLIATGRLLQSLISGSYRNSKMLLGFWLLLMICGTRPLPGWLARYVEGDVVSYDPQHDGPLDVVVVLGGGTSQGPARAQVNGAGDRVVLAAELFHQGLTKQLVTTGEATPGVSAILISPSDQTVEIWTKLGIPRQAIETIGGRNTSEELARLAELKPQLAGPRIGLLTSALHLPRAMRLAGKQHLEVLPIAADQRLHDSPWTLLDFIPSAGRFADLGSCQHELMAKIVGR